MSLKRMKTTIIIIIHNNNTIKEHKERERVSECVAVELTMKKTV
jgi:hypothetical protein